MRSAAAGRRYARALFGLAADGGQVADVRRELSDLAAVLEQSPALRKSLFQPLHRASERRSLLRAVAERLGAGELMRRFLAYLVDQRRLIDFPSIRAEYERLADAASGRARAEIVSASALTDAQRERLKSALSARTGREIELSETVDPALVGGAVATVGGLVFDGSLRAQLEHLRASLTKG